ncbi:hypothetical protein [uncultured Enterococcus sp.]|uniref:hypothetical protein n=1 Tax=uncultured Enterococcus sp. TaxID=167972 RepID=UPI002AA6AAD7|nr:hypothetical protein [uncultured Enterococcus sp.]
MKKLNVRKWCFFGLVLFSIAILGAFLLHNENSTAGKLDIKARPSFSEAEFKKVVKTEIEESNYDEVEQLFSKWQEEEELYGDEREAERYKLLGNLYLDTIEKSEDVVILLTKAITSYEEGYKIFPEKERDSVWLRDTYYRKAVVTFVKGASSEQEETLLEALETLEKSLSYEEEKENLTEKYHHLSADIYYYLGAIKNDIERYRVAASYYEKCSLLDARQLICKGAAYKFISNVENDKTKKQEHLQNALDCFDQAAARTSKAIISEKTTIAYLSFKDSTSFMYMTSGLNIGGLFFQKAETLMHKAEMSLEQEDKEEGKKLLLEAERNIDLSIDYDKKKVQLYVTRQVIYEYLFYLTNDNNYKIKFEADEETINNLEQDGGK